MARLRQSFTRVVLQALQGLGVSKPEYEEAKELVVNESNCRPIWTSSNLLYGSFKK
jgi:hypothetical protein